ncbi:MAG: amidohydrolase family protein [Selenomonadaceae bacterium]|nr:amidohydrolase family protein [Selenomonadaceae bacterium]
MDIIDAHLHFAAEAYFDRIALAAGHENNAPHLQAAYREYGIVGGVAMGGNCPPSLEKGAYPPFLKYCLGLDEATLRNPTPELPFIARHLAKKECLGLKLYPGYIPFYIYDDFMAPIYELAAACDKPVAVHTGLTASGEGFLKYCHPRIMDEAATKFPKVRFVMCHLGEPWFEDAVAVLEKNHNVSADLSGILEGKIPDMAAFLRQKRFYVEQMQGWLAYLDDYSRLMFGTDWPLANLQDYIEFTKAVIPEEHWPAVFADNAERIYRCGFTVTKEEQT